MPLVSIVIPSYNHSNFISDAIKSVLNQTFTDFELIISDDCSTDGSKEIIENINDSRIKTNFFQKNVGAAENLNYAIRLAKGKYIALLNSDDLWEKNKLEKQVNYLEKNTCCGAVFSDVNFINEYGKILTQEEYAWANIFTQTNRTSGEWLFRFFFDLNCICHPSMLIRREIYEKVSLYDGTLRQLPDFLMWINVVKISSIHILEEKLVKFRILNSEKNTSSDTRENHTRNLNEISLIMEDFFENTKKDLFKKGFFEYLKNKSFESEIEYEIEKAFMYFNIKHRELIYLYSIIGLKKLRKLLLNEEAKKVLIEKYNFNEKDFFKLTGEISFENKEPIIKENKNLFKKIFGKISSVLRA